MPAVPTEAIVSYHGQDYIFVLKNNTSTTQRETDSTKAKDADLEFERVQVVKGTSDIGFTEVTFKKSATKNTDSNKRCILCIG